jgi:hypothetical protein
MFVTVPSWPIGRVESTARPGGTVYISAFLTRVSGLHSSAVAPVLLLVGGCGAVGVATTGALFDKHPRLASVGPVALLAVALARGVVLASFGARGTALTGALFAVAALAVVLSDHLGPARTSPGTVRTGDPVGSPAGPRRRGPAFLGVVQRSWVSANESAGFWHAEMVDSRREPPRGWPEGGLRSRLGSEAGDEQPPRLPGAQVTRRYGEGDLRANGNIA